ncbi:DUF192 domain-containing protein [Hassallia byssoidea VB512170]|uniref:DUF192 domain-containing protein n=1 Tax=Hassallia byssoidea VB512170 TaxID=1304833 RepID=A0A846H2X4_9CYAN|nr:DUF192 domain-containing protein [Hassalia byssoidea]NEU71004.1 DUF192 domain-containing protein [Hassalia byssoidea VB512170]
MIRWLILLPMLLSVALFGCSEPTPAKPPSTKFDSQLSASAPSGQTLPISGVAIVPNGTKINLEVARTPKEQEIGLMYRKVLPRDRGMLFQFRSAQPVSFWMKNTLIPLDMIFLRQGVVQYIAANVPPCTADPCPSYGPQTPIDTVIELRSGRAAELSLKVSDRVKIEFLNPGSSRR